MSSDAAIAWQALSSVRAKIEPVLETTLMQSTGLSLASYNVLEQLGSAASEMNSTEISAGTFFSRSRISRVIDELAQMDLVARRPDARDERSSIIDLTDTGRRRLEEASVAFEATADREIGRRLSPAHLRQLTALLEQVRADEAPSKV